MCKKLCVNVTAYKLSDKRPGFSKTCDFETYEKYQIWVHFPFYVPAIKMGWFKQSFVEPPKS